MIIRNRPSKEGYVCPESEFQKLSFLVLRRRPCRCQDFTIVFVLLFSVAVAVSVSFVAISAALCRCFKAILLQCRNLHQQYRKKVVKTSVIKGDPPKGGATENTTVVCVGLMGFKSENEKGSVKIRRCP